MKENNKGEYKMKKLMIKIKKALGLKQKVKTYRLDENYNLVVTESWESY